MCRANGITLLKQKPIKTKAICALKEPCSILAPELKITGISNPSLLNYAFIPAFGNRYYYVTNWTSDHNLWVATLKVDHLASWRTDVLNTYQHVLRSASLKDTFIINSKYVVTDDIDTVVDNFIGDSDGMSPFPSGTQGANMTYVMEISNNSVQGKVNGLQYLALDSDQIKKTINSVLNDNNTFGWGATEADFGLTSAISRSIVNPLQYVGNTYMLPFVPGQLSNVDSLKVGFWTLTHPGGQLKAIVPNFPGNAVYQWIKKLKLRPHPQNHTHGQYLNAYPYTEYTLYAGPFGTVKLNTNSIIKELDMTGEDPYYEVTCEVKVDMFGKAVMEVFDGSLATRKTLAKAYADVAVPFSLTQTKNNILSWGSQMIGTSLSIMQGNAQGAVYQANGLVSGIDNAFPKPEVKGQNGSALCDMEKWHLMTEYKRVSCEEQINTNLVGDPLCQVVKLSDLSGYCQTDVPWLPLSCTKTEIDLIASDLTSGVYIE